MTTECRKAVISLFRNRFIADCIIINSYEFLIIVTIINRLDGVVTFTGAQLNNDRSFIPLEYVNTADPSCVVSFA